jgi:hypothetical protein
MTNATNSTATETARAIRAALKAAGIASKAVSVRSSETSLEGYVAVSVVDMSVPLCVVAPIALQFSAVDRDTAGNLLRGGNIHVSVSRTSEAFDAARRSLVDAFPRAEGTRATMFGHVVRWVDFRFVVTCPDGSTFEGHGPRCAGRILETQIEACAAA